jgi:alpha-D-ribose 1-methylphosphonate 5-triphosphate synthase subunit PhnG
MNCLSVLARAPHDQLKRFADKLIPDLGEIQVIENRTGLVMLPMSEPVKGTTFFLGEVLVAEARVRVNQVEGYAACLGRDVEQALALALIDAANAGGVAQKKIAKFLAAQSVNLEHADAEMLKQVEATRVEMETFEWLMPK